MKIPVKNVKCKDGIGYENVPDFKVVIAIGECSGGNETVGDMWLETNIFNKESTLEDVINWANKKMISGRLILTIPEE